MHASLQIRWTNPESGKYIDVLPMSLFADEKKNSEITHDIKMPYGKRYKARCEISVTGPTAKLLYEKNANPPDKIWQGETTILFADVSRQAVTHIEWRNSKGKLENLSPKFSLINLPASYVIKTVPVELPPENDTLSITAKPINSKNGNEVSSGDEVFIWTFEDDGGVGLSMHGKVQAVDKSTKRNYEITIVDVLRNANRLGKVELERFIKFPGESAELSIYQNLKEYSHRGIRRITDDESRVLRRYFPAQKLTDESDEEIARLIRLGNVASRPGRSAFGRAVRRAYGGKCAITRCEISEALEAAHIKVIDAQDDNSLKNGILLRADIHALFDAGLITLALDGNSVEISKRLADSSFSFLRKAPVFCPESCQPSRANIRHHRLRFGFKS